MNRTFRRILWSAMLLCAGTTAGDAAELITQSEAARFGLARTWFAQIGSLAATGPLSHVSLEHGLLMAQSTSGVLTALDAETGRTVWTTQVGPPNHLSSEATANDEYVVVLNGSVLYVLDRATGHIQWQRSVGGAPGAGPGVSSTHIFVPMVSGLVEGYSFEKGVKQTPWIYKSAGRVLIPPMTTEQTVSWSTEKGYFYVADPAGKGIRYRLETRGSIQTRPGDWSPNLYAASTDGSLYAINEATGKIIWRYSVGDAIYASPVAIESKVFVTSETTGLYCLDTKAAEVIWNAPGIRQFVSASPSRIYAIDQLGRLAILDAQRGARLGSMNLEGISIKVVNGQTDRIYLVSDKCLVQCLRQANLKKPVIYTAPPPPDADEEQDKPKRPVTKPAEPAANPRGDEAADDAMPAEGGQTDEPAVDDPFSG
jgi:outer membrane protein assembly factor BamB